MKQSTGDYGGETELERNKRELSNDLDTLHFKFNSHKDKKLRAEYHRKVNEIRDKISLLINNV